MLKNLKAKALLILCLSTLWSTYAFSQGHIKGLLWDVSLNESLPTALVQVDGTENGARSDFDGFFDVEVPAGTYDLTVSFMGLEDLHIQGITVAEAQTIELDTVKMGDKTEDVSLETAVVTAEVRANTENSMIGLKKISSNVIDGMSSETFRKTGDANAAASIKRISGVSVSNGKYVFVRGLGDRYSKTTLNNLDVPGLDPDRNSLQIDLFPSSIIENVIVNKSFSADLPADFTGGLLNIDLKDYPLSKQKNISLNMGYNPSFHFQDNYLYYKGSSTDFLGFDNGQRAIPATDNVPSFVEALSDVNANGPKSKRYSEILRSFNPIMAASQKTSGMNFGMNFSLGDSKYDDAKNRTTGYNLMAYYTNKTSFYQNADYSQYGLSADPNVDKMQLRQSQKGNIGSNEVLLALYGGYAIKKENSKLAFKLLHLQNGESKAGIFDFQKENQGTEFKGFQHNLEYTQRSLSNLLISYDKKLGREWEMELNFSPTQSRVYNPDIRFTRYVERGGPPVIGTEGGLPQRIWRDLNETSISTKADFTKNLEIRNKESKFKTGLSYTYKYRDYVIRSFFINPKPSSTSITLTGNPNELFYPENLWPSQERPDLGVIYQADFVPNNPNQYQAAVNYLATYGSLEYKLSSKLNSVIGLRAEQYNQNYQGQNQLGTIVLNNDRVLSDLGLYPALNLVYDIKETQKLRFSASRTVARPSMKELSYAEIYDPMTGRTFIGGLFKDEDNTTGTVYWDGNLHSTKIQNADLRWEMYPSVGNTLSLGAFYKYLIDPIEMVQSARQAGSFQPRNVGNGTVMGAELEFRQKLNVLSSKLENWTFNTNLTYTYSQIKYSLTEKTSREENKRTGQVIGDSRPMAGQAPYLINAGIAYSKNGIESGLYYNVQGPTLMYVGIVDRPDIYSVPFQSLNFTTNYSFGVDDKFQIAFKAENLLGYQRREVYHSYGDENRNFTSFNPGRLFKLTLGMKL